VCGQSHTPPRRAQIIEAFTSTKFQEAIKGAGDKKADKKTLKRGEATRDLHKDGTEPVFAFMDMKMSEPGKNFLIYLSKLVPTMIWSIIQLGIVLVFAGIYMIFPCSDFVVPDEDSSCTGKYKDKDSRLCAAPPCRSTPFRAARSPPAHPGNSRLRCGTRRSR
jgi:hypothetical protein